MNKFLLGTLVLIGGVILENKAKVYDKAFNLGKDVIKKAKKACDDCCSKVKENIDDIAEEEK